MSVLEVDKPTKELLVKLLSQKIPFLCEGYFNDWKGTVFLSEKQDHYPHVGMVVGYRKNDTYLDRLEFVLHRPNGAEPQWGWDIEGCSRITLIQKTDELATISLPENHRVLISS